MSGVEELKDVQLLLLSPGKWVISPFRNEKLDVGIYNNVTSCLV